MVRCLPGNTTSLKVREEAKKLTRQMELVPSKVYLVADGKVFGKQASEPVNKQGAFMENVPRQVHQWLGLYTRLSGLHERSRRALLTVRGEGKIDQSLTENRRHVYIKDTSLNGKNKRYVTNTSKLLWQAGGTWWIGFAKEVGTRAGVLQVCDAAIDAGAAIGQWFISGSAPRAAAARVVNWHPVPNIHIGSGRVGAKALAVNKQENKQNKEEVEYDALGFKIAKKKVPKKR